MPTSRSRCRRGAGGKGARGVQDSPAPMRSQASSAALVLCNKNGFERALAVVGRSPRGRCPPAPAAAAVAPDISNCFSPPALPWNENAVYSKPTTSLPCRSWDRAGNCLLLPCPGFVEILTVLLHRELHSYLHTSFRRPWLAPAAAHVADVNPCGWYKKNAPFPVAGGNASPLPLGNSPVQDLPTSAETNFSL